MDSSSSSTAINGQQQASASSPSAPNAPNRKGFEQRIWQVNNRLAKLQEQVKGYWDEERRAKFGALRAEMDRERREYGMEAEDELHLMGGLRELEARLHAKQREVHEMEQCPDLVYKSLPTAKQKSAQLEAQFKERRFTNIRDEQLWVAQMDRMQRNIARLAKYVPLVEQKRTLEEELREQRGRVRKVRQKMRAHKDEAGECRKQLGILQQPFRRLREALAEMRAEKRALVERYNAQKEAYWQWIREERAEGKQGTVAGGGSMPAAGLLHDGGQEGGDSMDLFHNQKEACTRLIAYLEGLKQFAEHRVDGGGREREQQTKKAAEDDAGDSADELPEAFHKHFGLDNGQKCRDKLTEDVRKLAKKQAMPLSHGLDWIRLFGEIDVHPPRTHAEVATTLREVQMALEFYVGQTAQEDEEGEGEGGEQHRRPDWLSMMAISGHSSLASPIASSSLLSPASFASSSPRLSFGHHPPPSSTPPTAIMASPWPNQQDDEPCSSSADSSIGGIEAATKRRE